MTEIEFGKYFLDSVERLPKAIQQKLDALIATLATNPFDPRLHTKPLVGNFEGYLSFRITRDWRVVFIYKSQTTIELIRAMHRKDAYR